MPLRINVNPVAMNPKGFPKLQIDLGSGLLIFMVGETTGTVLQPGTTEYFAGYYGQHWKPHKLSDYAGIVTMENM